MNSEEKDVRKGELKDEELEEISGGVYVTSCHCPTCNYPTKTRPGAPCPMCAMNGITSYVVKD